MISVLIVMISIQVMINVFLVTLQFNPMPAPSAAFRANFEPRGLAIEERRVMFAYMALRIAFVAKEYIAERTLWGIYTFSLIRDANQLDLSRERLSMRTNLSQVQRQIGQGYWEVANRRAARLKRTLKCRP